MTRLASTIILMLALIGSSLAQTAPKAAKKPSVQSKQSIGCKLVGTVKGTKVWAGDCISAEPVAPATPEPEPNDIRAGKQQ